MLENKITYVHVLIASTTINSMFKEVLEITLAKSERKRQLWGTWELGAKRK